MFVICCPALLSAVQPTFFFPCDLKIAAPLGLMFPLGFKTMSFEVIRGTMEETITGWFNFDVLVIYLNTKWSH